MSANKKKGIILLMNGLEGPSRLSESSYLRVRKALEIRHKDQWFIVSTGFTVNKPPFLDRLKVPVNECDVAAKYLVESGVSREHILTEFTSKDTIGNAIFSRLLHTECLGITKLTVISSEFHLARVKLIFDWVFSLSGLNDLIYEINYIAAPDPKQSDGLREAILAKEEQSCLDLVALKERLTTFQAVHQWLFREHRAYTFDLKVSPLPEILEKGY